MAITCQEHLISLHVVRDLLLLASYLFGIYLFTRRESEYLYNLVDRTFIKCSYANCEQQSTRLTYILG